MGLRTSSARTGFSLLEILVALSVMVVGMTSIMVLFAVGVTTHKRSVDQMNAALAAESIYSGLKGKYTLYQIEEWKKAEQKKHRRKRGKKRITLDEAGYLSDIPDKGEDPPEVPNFPGYHYRVFFTRLDDRGDAVLAEIVIIWKKAGDPVTESYKAVLFKKPF